MFAEQPIEAVRDQERIGSRKDHRREADTTPGLDSNVAQAVPESVDGHLDQPEINSASKCAYIPHGNL